MAFDMEKALALRASGKTLDEISSVLGVAKSTLSRRLPKMLRTRPTQLDVETAVEMRLAGETYDAIGYRFRVSRQAAWKAIKDDPRVIAYEMAKAGLDIDDFVGRLRSVLPAMKAAA